MRSVFVLSALAAIIPALATPSAAPLTTRGDEITCIIKIKVGINPDSFKSRLTSYLHNPWTLKYQYTIFNGVAITMDRGDVPLLRDISDVEYFEEDQTVSLPIQLPIGQDGTTPRYERGSCPEPSFDNYGGKGVTIYGIDTGIKIEHACFGGRARWGKTFGPEQIETDLNGHGTHTAATAAGNYWGVARLANIVSVKVLNAVGSGQNSDVVAGVDYACDHFEKSGKPPSIATMSLGGSASQLLDSAVTNCIDKGMHFTVAAGNDNKDANDYSPARVPLANTIGAINATCYKADFSNFGNRLDAHGFGVDITSAWIGPGKNDSKTISGTSMATPYVAGILAVALEKDQRIKPQELTSKMKEKAYHGAIGFPEGTTNDVAQLWQS
ncbi:Alkaline protease 2 OS=Neosartorya fumigata (strain CEA10 / CBS 144,89 / FGSC A1163) GN=alp2 PE=3 SV=1 [Rhizoctonia solani AG-1 IB]|uniref:Alkaline protease 2 n=2 Tax=Thanatephorus cucumeris (strain AG1-IB / isolate 7/3/14) TaxID=1108050 RepID=A0A0B7G3G7_THACB|nr:Alkaline protease 2 OS=Neosartorya fumigata (strain CEA10 / CBS 144,89 / FGSC A1163) GN=alp2 PE=3 SV=1 [Rhizoctonia solani AG-1 IB]